jgi:hypothetical protein
MRTTASFRLFGDGSLTARAVSSRLGLESSRSYEAGDRVSKRSSGVRTTSLWLLSSGDIETADLDEHLRRLLAVLEPVKAQLWELDEMGYNANWFCYVASSLRSMQSNSTEGSSPPCWPCPVTSGSMSAATQGITLIGQSARPRLSHLVVVIR